MERCWNRTWTVSANVLLNPEEAPEYTTVLSETGETAGSHVLLRVTNAVPLKPGHGGAFSFLAAMRSSALQSNAIKTAWMAITQFLKETQKIVVRSDMTHRVLASEFSSWAFGETRGDNDTSN